MGLLITTNGGQNLRPVRGESERGKRGEKGEKRGREVEKEGKKGVRRKNGMNGEKWKDLLCALYQMMRIRFYVL